VAGYRGMEKTQPVFLGHRFRRGFTRAEFSRGEERCS
jgi:hypothetical protein